MLSIIHYCHLAWITYFEYQGLGLKIDISTKKYEIGLIGSNYGYEVLMPILNAIDGVSLTFAAPNSMGLEKRENLIKAGIKVLGQSEFFDYENTKIVFIAVPPSSQLNVSNLALKNKKNLYIEKPVGINYFETLKIEELLRAQDKKAFVGFQFRYDPGIIALKKLLDLKILGNISQIKVNWHTSGISAKYDKSNWRNNSRQGGGVHRDFLCHVLDYLKWSTNNSIALALQNLILDPKVESSLFNLSIVSDQPIKNFISINISRGFQSISYWEIEIKFENGEFLINSSFPFLLSGYKTQINGTKEFCLFATEFLKSNEFLNNSSNQGLARDYALNNYFKAIVNSVFEGISVKLPDLEDAKFTQLISDHILEQLILD